MSTGGGDRLPYARYSIKKVINIMKSGGWHFISSWTSDILLHICYLVFASRTSHVGRYDSYGLQNWIDFYQASSKLNDFLADSPFFIICPRRVILIEVWSEYWCHSICLFVFTVIRLCILKWIDPLMYIPHGPHRRLKKNIFIYDALLLIALETGEAL